MDKTFYKLEQFIDKEGRTVMTLTEKNDSAPNEFVGKAFVKSPKGGIPVEFPIKEVANVTEAFEKFDEAIDAFAEEKRKEYEASQEDNGETKAEALPESEQEIVDPDDITSPEGKIIYRKPS